jgi:hypothetical protein
MTAKTNQNPAEYFKQLHDLTQSKLRAANTFKKEMERIQNKLEGLGRYLADSTPKGLVDIFEEAGVIPHLLELGEAYLEVQLPEPDFELGKPEEVFTLFVELKKKWKWIVKIQLGQTFKQVKSGERLEVYFSSYMG